MRKILIFIILIIAPMIAMSQVRPKVGGAKADSVSFKDDNWATWITGISHDMSGTSDKKVPTVAALKQYLEGFSPTAMRVSIDSLADTTARHLVRINQLFSTSHSHTNMTILNAITASFTTAQATAISTATSVNNTQTDSITRHNVRLKALESGSVGGGGGSDSTLRTGGTNDYGIIHTYRSGGVSTAQMRSQSSGGGNDFASVTTTANAAGTTAVTIDSDLNTIIGPTNVNDSLDIVYTTPATGQVYVPSATGKVKAVQLPTQFLFQITDTIPPADTGRTKWRNLGGSVLAGKNWTRIEARNDVTLNDKVPTILMYRRRSGVVTLVTSTGTNFTTAATIDVANDDILSTDTFQFRYSHGAGTKRPEGITIICEAQKP